MISHRIGSGGLGKGEYGVLSEASVQASDTAKEFLDDYPLVFCWRARGNGGAEAAVVTAATGGGLGGGFAEIIKDEAVSALSRMDVVDHDVQFALVAQAFLLDGREHCLEAIDIGVFGEGCGIATVACGDAALDKACAVEQAHAGVDGDFVVGGHDLFAPFLQRTGLGSCGEDGFYFAPEFKDQLRFGV